MMLEIKNYELRITNYELRITNYSSAHSRHNERKRAANCGKNAAERDKSRSARRSHRMALGAIKATPASALPTTTFACCVGDPIICETLRWFLWGPRDWFS